MKFYYDLHIHSDLSPCAEKEMTPNNIVNMAYIKGLNIISVTDHNTTKNLPAINEVANKLNIKVIFGIEVTTKEEVHALCYFKNCDDAEKFGDLIYESLPNINNNINIFGEQNIYNANDEKIGQLDKLLLNASSYSVDDLYNLSKQYNGIMILAHVNKKSNGILSVLGFIPFNLKLEFIEIFSKEKVDERFIKNYKILKNSDAHQLTDIQEAINYVELNSLDEIYNYLNL
ncbi:MAG: hypothetical protein K0Q97_730 [Bacillota bacterium]|jgi:PHP family Zn ribbon phosphoesterase|nr:hypothetical protein [Bacillota bacterium]